MNRTAESQRNAVARHVRGENEHQRALVAVVGLVLLAMAGCHSSPSPTKMQEEQKAAAAPAQNPAPLLNLNCVFDWINKPTESFHYSYARHSESDSATQEADVSPQTLDGTFTSAGQANPPIPVHAVRSDSNGWQSAVGQLQMGFGMPASLMMANQMSSALVREAAEKVNGYDTVRYSVDTARLGATDRGLLGTTSEKGTVWVTGPGCPVKIVMDTETGGNGGPASRTHYDEAIVKK